MYSSFLFDILVLTNYVRRNFTLNPNEIQNEQEEQEKFTKEIYLGKAKKYLKIATGFLIFDLLTYLFFGFFGAFDFGVYFEIVGFVTALLSLYFLNHSAISLAKGSILIGGIAVGWLFLYDIFEFLSYLSEILEAAFFYGFFFSYEIFDIFLLLILIFFFLAYRSITRSERSINYQTDKDWFYDQK